MSIKLKLYRKYHKEIIKKLNFKNRYPEIFSKGKDRIYIPIKFDLGSFSKSQTELNVERFLDNEGYTIVDYIQGTCKKQDSTDTRLFKIGKTLELIKKKREQEKYFLITIRNKYCDYDDIADLYFKYFEHFSIDAKGGDNKITLTISDSDLKYVQNKLSETYNVKPDNKKPDTFIYDKTKNKFTINIAPGTSPKQKSSSDIIKEFSNDKTRNVKNIREFLICFSRHPYDLIGMSTNRGWSSCMKHHNDKDIIPGVLNDIKYGTIIAYLIRKNDKNIQNPVARINIKPFTTYDSITENKITNTKNTILIPVQRIYGEKIQAFLDEVNKFIYQSQKLKLKNIKIVTSINDHLYIDTMSRNYKTGNLKLKGIIPANIYGAINFYTNTRLKNVKIQETFLNNKIIWEGDHPNDKPNIRSHYFGNGYRTIFFNKKRKSIQGSSLNSFGIKQSNHALSISSTTISEKRLEEIIKKLANNKDPKIKTTEIINLKNYTQTISNELIPYLQNPLPKAY